MDYFRANKTNSASLAKERLQIIVAHERSLNQNKRQQDYLPALQQEILAVVRKYVHVSEEQIKVSMDKSGDCEILELNIALPEGKTESNAVYG
jgi:cell division topological specificity factor